MSGASLWLEPWTGTLKKLRDKMRALAGPAALDGLKSDSLEGFICFALLIFQFVRERCAPGMGARTFKSRFSWVKVKLKYCCTVSCSLCPGRGGMDSIFSLPCLSLLAQMMKEGVKKNRCKVGGNRLIRRMRRVFGGWSVLAALLTFTAAWLAVQIWTNGSSPRMAAADGSLGFAAPGASRIPIRRSGARSASEKPNIEEAIRMNPDDWRNYLASHVRELDPELSDELIELAVELEEAFAAGLSPRSVEAQVYGEAMLVLLKSELLDD